MLDGLPDGTLKIAVVRQNANCKPLTELVFIAIMKRNEL